MQWMGKAGAVVLAMAGLMTLSACEGMFDNDQAHTKTPRRYNSRPVVVKPEVSSPAAYKTCTETFKLEVGTPRYDKCIASLGELETESK